VYLAQLGFTPVAIGIVLTATVLSSALYTLVISFLADRIGRRKTLVFFALTDFVAGTLLFVSRDWWAPVLAGIVGNMTVGAGEVGPFLSLEQAMIPKTCRPDRRTLAFSVYNLVGRSAPRGPPELHRLFAALPGLSDLGTPWRRALLQPVPTRRTGPRRRDAIRAVPARSAHRGEAVGPFRS